MNNPFALLTKNAKRSLSYSAEISEKMGSKEVESVHLFLGLLKVKEGVASRMFSVMNVDIDQTVSAFAGGVDLSKVNGRKDLSVKISPALRVAINRAYRIARERSHVYVGTEHLLLALLEDGDEDFVKELNSSGVRVDEIRKNIFNFTTYPQGILSNPSQGEEDSKPTVLDVLGVDLTDLALRGKLDPLVGREKDLEKMINILSRRRKNNPVVVGEAGVGKTALVEGLAQKIVRGEVPESLRDTRIISLDVTGIVAGSKMRGDMEEKMMAVINEVSNSPRTILFIDEIHTILGMGGAVGGGLDLAGVLKPALVHGNFRCIGATTVVDFNRYFDDDPALSRRFQQVLLEESSVDETIAILGQIKPLVEKHHNVVITDEAIEAAAHLTDQYISDRYLPDKAIDLMDEAAAARRLQLEGEHDDLGDAMSEYLTMRREKEGAVKKGDLESASDWRQKEMEQKEKISEIKKKRGKVRKSKKYWVDEAVVRRIISGWTGIPLSTIGVAESSELLRLEDTLEKEVIGQTDAVERVAAAIKRARTGVTSGERPWASFLFLGPTGVGKTELAKVLTKVLFGDEDRLVQIDMSEMMEMHSVSKLVGSPPGYVGYKEGGQLTEQVRRQPHSVILFDEIEKAHIDVLNVLLQILEYGHLTDGKGRRVNFRNTVIILTSNIGAEEIRRDRVLGFEARDPKDSRSDKDIIEAYDGMKETLENELKDTLPPELLNRLDDVVIFRSLTRRDAKKIVDLLLDDLNARLSEKMVKVSLDPSAKDFIVERGFSEEYGARPLRRTIQEYVETPVASYLLQYGGGVVSKSVKTKNPKEKKLEVTLPKNGNVLTVSKSS